MGLRARVMPRADATGVPASSAACALATKLALSLRGSPAECGVRIPRLSWWERSESGLLEDPDDPEPRSLHLLSLNLCFLRLMRTRVRNRGFFPLLPSPQPYPSLLAALPISSDGTSPDPAAVLLRRTPLALRGAASGVGARPPEPFASPRPAAHDAPSAPNAGRSEAQLGGGGELAAGTGERDNVLVGAA